jgi:hypothetical protein
MKITYLLITGIFLLHSADAARTVTVNALRHEIIDELEGATFRINFIEMEDSGSPGQVEMARGFVREALLAKGFKEAPLGEKAVISVSLACGVSGPILKSRVEKSTIVSGTAADGGGGFVLREPLERWEWKESLESGSGRAPFISGHKAWDPYFNAEPDVRRGDARLVKTYEKYVYMTATVNLVGKLGTKKALEILRIVATKEDGRRELEPFVPVLAATSGAFVGETTDGEETVKIQLEGTIARVMR